MKTLVSMTEFVSAQEERLTSAVKSRSKEFSSQYLDRIFAYGRFLKQPLTLSMFVPCDEDGKVLEEPVRKVETYTGHGEDYDMLELETYNAAKESVLFEGWEWNWPGEFACTQEDKSVMIDEEFCFFTTIESLQRQVVLYLTPAALRQIGL